MIMHIPKVGTKLFFMDKEYSVDSELQLSVINIESHNEDLIELISHELVPYSNSRDDYHSKQKDERVNYFNKLQICTGEVIGSTEVRKIGGYDIASVIVKIVSIKSIFESIDDKIENGSIYLHIGKNNSVIKFMAKNGYKLKIDREHYELYNMDYMDCISITSDRDLKNELFFKAFNNNEINIDSTSGGIRGNINSSGADWSSINNSVEYSISGSIPVSRRNFEHHTTNSRRYVEDDHRFVYTSKWLSDVYVNYGIDWITPEILIWFRDNYPEIYSVLINYGYEPFPILIDEEEQEELLQEVIWKPKTKFEKFKQKFTRGD